MLPLGTHEALVMLNGQAVTAFGAATSQNLTAILGCHAGTKTMNAFALKLAGLESTFHENTQVKAKKKMILWPDQRRVKWFDHFLANDQTLVKFFLGDGSCT